MGMSEDTSKQARSSYRTGYIKLNRQVLIVELGEPLVRPPQVQEDNRSVCVGSRGWTCSCTRGSKFGIRTTGKRVGASFYPVSGNWSLLAVTTDRKSAPRPATRRGRRRDPVEPPLLGVAEGACLSYPLGRLGEERRVAVEAGRGPAGEGRVGQHPAIDRGKGLRQVGRGLEHVPEDGQSPAGTEPPAAVAAPPTGSTVPGLSGDDRVERPARAFPGFDRRHLDLEALAAGEVRHPRVGIDPEHPAPGRLELPRHDARAASERRGRRGRGWLRRSAPPARGDTGAAFGRSVRRPSRTTPPPAGRDEPGRARVRERAHSAQPRA